MNQKSVKHSTVLAFVNSYLDSGEKLLYIESITRDEINDETPKWMVLTNGPRFLVFESPNPVGNTRRSGSSRRGSLTANLQVEASIVEERTSSNSLSKNSSSADNISPTSDSKFGFTSNTTTDTTAITDNPSVPLALRFGFWVDKHMMLDYDEFEGILEVYRFDEQFTFPRITSEIWNARLDLLKKLSK